MSGPAIVAPNGRSPARIRSGTRSIRNTRGTPGASARNRRTAWAENDITRTGCGPCARRVRQAEPAQLRHDGLLDPAGVARRVLGLDRQQDGPRAAGDQVQQGGQGEDPARRIGEHVLAGPRLQATIGEPALAQRPPRRARALLLGPGPEVMATQVGQGLGGDHAPAVAGPVDPPIVHADEVPVGGEADVALQPVGALLDGQLVGGQGVLGAQRARAPVGDHQGTAGHGPSMPARPARPRAVRPGGVSQGPARRRRQGQVRRAWPPSAAGTQLQCARRVEEHARVEQPVGVDRRLDPAHPVDLLRGPGQVQLVRPSAGRCRARR